MTLDEMRREFELSANRSVSMPIAGAIVWFTVALLSTQVDERTGGILNYVLRDFLNAQLEMA